jgi:hypothetical protein
VMMVLRGELRGLFIPTCRLLGIFEQAPALSRRYLPC